MGDKVRLMPMVRQYVASLGAIHEKLRKALRSDVEEWERTVRGAIERFKEAHPAEDTLGLHAIKVVEEAQEPEEKIELYAKPIEYRHALEKRNRNLGSLARRYVSSESV